MATTTITTTKKVLNKFERNADIDEFLEKSLTEAGYGGVDITTSPVGTRITLFVQRPGLVIGRRGMGIRDLTEKLEKKFGLPNPQISVVEEEVPELNPRIMCSRIAQTVVRGTAFRRAALWAMNSMMNAGALGVEITISGKLRSERAHFEKYVSGVVPKSGETADRIVRRATTDVLLKMGLYGVKVNIAIKNSIAPDVELIEPAASPISESNSEEKMADQGGQQEQSQQKEGRPLGPLDEVRRAKRSQRKEMKRLKTDDLAKLSDADLIKRLNDLRSELSRLRSAAARGTLKKELGEIKTVRRNIARILTAMSAKKLAVNAAPLKKAIPPVAKS